MKSLKDNFFVKTAYSYVNLGFLLYPILIIILIINIIISGASFFPSSGSGNTVLMNVDLFDLFGKEKLINEITYQSITLWVFILIVNSGIVLGIYYGLKKLNKFMKNVFEDKPFIEENGKHLKMIGIVIMVLSTLVYLNQMSSIYFTTLSVSAGIKYLYFVAIIISSLFNPYLVVGLVVFVIGEIIVRASELKEEQDLTV